MVWGDKHCLAAWPRRGKVADSLEPFWARGAWSPWQPVAPGSAALGQAIPIVGRPDLGNLIFWWLLVGWT